MNENYKKLRMFFLDKGLTQKDVANILEVSEQYVNSIINGRTQIGKKAAMKWQNHFGLSASWLLTGDGDMLVNGNKEIKNYDIKIGKDGRVINAGGNVSNSQNDCGEAEMYKKEIEALKSRIKELEADKKNLQNMVDYLMESKKQ